MAIGRYPGKNGKEFKIGSARVNLQKLQRSDTELADMWKQHLISLPTLKARIAAQQGRTMDKFYEENKFANGACEIIADNRHNKPFLLEECEDAVEGLQLVHRLNARK